MNNDTDSVRTRAARFIVDCEARRDRAGHMKVYKLPAGDGGGTFEVAGINDRYHPFFANELREMIERADYESAEAMAAECIADYTDIVTQWVKLPGLEVFLRDCAFNRGPKGSLRILQLAVGVPDDGKFGPVTRAAVRRLESHPAAFLESLRIAREIYELRIAPPVGARAKFWHGLVNRWDKALAFAQTFA